MVDQSSSSSAHRSLPSIEVGPGPLSLEPAPEEGVRKEPQLAALQNRKVEQESIAIPTRNAEQKPESSSERKSLSAPPLPSARMPLVRRENLRRNFEYLSEHRKLQEYKAETEAGNVIAERFTREPTIRGKIKIYFGSVREMDQKRKEIKETLTYNEPTLSQKPAVRSRSRSRYSEESVMRKIAKMKDLYSTSDGFHGWTGSLGQRFPKKLNAFIAEMKGLEITPRGDLIDPEKAKWANAQLQELYTMLVENQALPPVSQRITDNWRTKGNKLQRMLLDTPVREPAHSVHKETPSKFSRLKSRITGFFANLFRSPSGRKASMQTKTAPSDSIPTKSDPIPTKIEKKGGESTGEKLDSETSA